MIVKQPLASCKLTFSLSVQNICINGAEEEFSFVKIHEENSEYQYDNTNNQHDIRNTSNWTNESIDNESHSNIMGQEPERSEGSKHPEDFECLKILSWKRHVEDGSCHDEEIHLIPSVSQVWIIIHAHSHSNQLHRHLEYEQVVEWSI